MIGYIYLITDTTNGKQYVGQHHYDKEELDPNYHGSGHIIKNIYSKRPETLKEEYVKTCFNQTEMDEWEKYFIFTNNTLYPNGYNLAEGGGGCVACEETRKKISESNKGRTSPNKGKPMSEEQKKKLSESLKGKHHTEESKRKMSEALIGEKNPFYGRQHSEESKKKMSKPRKGKSTYNKGKPMSEEQKKKLSESHKSNKGYWKGKKRSDETKKKISKTKTGVFNTKKSKQVIQFTLDCEFVREWPSMMEAQRNGFLSSKICQCCQGKKTQYKGFIWKYKD